MARYISYGQGLSLFSAYITKPQLAPMADRLLYVTPTAFGYQNADGSRSYVYGTGFVWDAATGQFTAGEVTAIAHYSKTGQFVDSLSFGTAPLSVLTLQASLESEGSAPGITQSTLLSGDDLLDGRFHPPGSTFGVTLDGGAGNDRILGSDNNDVLDGNGGDDFVQGYGGNDKLLGSGGNDRVWGGDGNDRVLGGAGQDQVVGEAGNDYLGGGLGNDQIYGGAGTDTAVFMQRFADATITRTATGITVTSADGADTLFGVERLGFDDGIYAWNAASSNWVRVSSNPGALYATVGMALTGTADDDTPTSGRNLTGGFRDDVIRGLGGNDMIDGGGGSDLLLGGAGDDTISAGAGFGIGVPGDRLYGGSGNDVLQGSRLGDQLFGESGEDTLTGNLGDDDLWGGAGADTFVFDGQTFFGGRQNYWNHDTVHDFEVGVDHLQVFGIDISGFTYANNADGDAVLTATGLTGAQASSITLVGVDAAVTAIGDLFA